jgi:hypothetical protein
MVREVGFSPLICSFSRHMRKSMPRLLRMFLDRHGAVVKDRAR